MLGLRKKAIDGQTENAGSEATPPSTPAVTTPKTPLLRGVSHLLAFPVALLFGAKLFLSARDARARLSAAVFTFSLCMLFGASALFHRSPVTFKHRKILHKLDHSAIFTLIAGTYTSLCMLALESEAIDYLLAFVWTGAVAGILKTFFLPRHRTLNVFLYLTLGWSVIPFGRELVLALGSEVTLWVLHGGICYSVGAFVYALKWPDPWPALFGFHEVFHVLVICASACHYCALRVLINSRA